MRVKHTRLDVITKYNSNAVTGVTIINYWSWSRPCADMSWNVLLSSASHTAVEIVQKVKHLCLRRKNVQDGETEPNFFFCLHDRVVFRPRWRENDGTVFISQLELKFSRLKLERLPHPKFFCFPSCSFAVYQRAAASAFSIIWPSLLGTWHEIVDWWADILRMPSFLPSCQPANERFLGYSA